MSTKVEGKGKSKGDSKGEGTSSEGVSEVALVDMYRECISAGMMAASDDMSKIDRDSDQFSMGICMVHMI